MSGRFYLPLANRGVVTLEGPDAGAFLQGLVSNDVEKASQQRAIYAALLTPQGKFLHDFILLRLGEAWLLDCEGARLQDLGRRLAAYRLRADVALADATEDFQVTALFGEEAEAAFPLPPEPGGACAHAGGVVLRDPRHPELGLRAVLPRGVDPASFEAAGFAPAAFEDYDYRRISLGAPDGARDMEVGRATLMECGFEAWGGVDFDKGCYVGQELTARTKHRGLTRRRLMRVALEGPVPAPGTAVLAGEREVGEMRSGLRDRAIALLRPERIEAAGGAPLTAGDSRVIPLDSL